MQKAERMGLADGSRLKSTTIFMKANSGSESSMDSAGTSGKEEIIMLECGRTSV